ncbi:MAG: NAD(P)/FAD-dependent oxidoreductase [Tepidisphaeraceae bacterium]
MRNTTEGRVETAPTNAFARPRVVIIGGGFAGLNAARSLAKTDVEVVLIDRRNHHLFQPLLYQVATAGLSPADIAAPIRKVLRRQRNASVILGEVDQIDVLGQRLHVGDAWINYDYLIVAAGVTHSYFGNPQWERVAPGLKTIEDALELRRRLLIAFEEAELETDSSAQRQALTFVVVGAGPTGVELAGAFAEIARHVVPKDFRRVDTRQARVVLIEAGPRVLPAFDDHNARDAQRQLQELGVEIRIGTKVTNIDEQGVTLASGERLAAKRVFWAAGVKASPLGAMLNVPLDNAGRVIVGTDCAVPGHPNVFVVGDLARMTDPNTGAIVPGVAQGALQSGAHVAGIIQTEVRANGRDEPLPIRPAFRYHDKGALATIGRRRAVGLISGVHVRGVIAWLVWAFVHVLFLVTFRNRLSVLLNWMWSYMAWDRGARLITGEPKGPDVKAAQQATPAAQLVGA